MFLAVIPFLFMEFYYSTAIYFSLISYGVDSVRPIQFTGLFQISVTLSKKGSILYVRGEELLQKAEQMRKDQIFVSDGCSAMNKGNLSSKSPS